MFDWLFLLLQKVEGRDKLSKLIIYLMKLSDSIVSVYREYPTYKLEKIAIHFQRARQFMRLGKFMLEYQQALALINQDSKKDQFGRLVKIILHAIFSFYWALDNLSLLAVFGMINMAQYQFTQTALTVKAVGMSIAAFFNLRTWLRLHYQELQIRKQLKEVKGSQNLQKSKELMRLVLKQWKIFLLCLKFFGDMLPTLGKSELARKVLGLKIPRTLQAIGGLINALVSCMIASESNLG